MLKCMSLFSQIVSEMSLSSVSFEQQVMKHGNDRKAKGFTSKAQLVAMIFSHLARADSLREITNGLVCCNDKLKHLGIIAAPKRSTLAYANEHRSADLVRRIHLETASAFPFKGYAREEWQEILIQELALSL